MVLKLPKMSTFWASVVIAAAGVLVYVVHLFARNILHLQPVAFFLVVVAFGLLCLGLIVKSL